MNLSEWQHKIELPFETNLSESEIALKAAIEGGKEIIQVYSKDFSSGLKSDDSPITEADLKSNKKIKEILSKTEYQILSEEDKALLNKLRITKFTSIGSSLKVGKISSGSADVYLTTTDKMKEWDTCASYCIIQEAGSKMTDMLGNDLSYNKKNVNHKNGILVTNGLVHDKIVDVCQKSE